MEKKLKERTEDFTKALSRLEEGGSECIKMSQQEMLNLKTKVSKQVLSMFN